MKSQYKDRWTGKIVKVRGGAWEPEADKSHVSRSISELKHALTSNKAEYVYGVWCLQDTSWRYFDVVGRKPFAMITLLFKDETVLECLVVTKYGATKHYRRSGEGFTLVSDFFKVKHSAYSEWVSILYETSLPRLAGSLPFVPIIHI